MTADPQQQVEGKFSLAGSGRTDFIWEFLLCEEGYAKLFICVCAFFFCLFRAAPVAYGGSQAKG